MCTNNLYNVTKNLKYKKTYENGQITHYLEHRGMGTGLVTEKKTIPGVMSHFHTILQPDPTGSTSNTTGSRSDRVKQTHRKLPFYFG